MTGQMTTFSEIPYDWLNPGTYLEVRPNYKRQGLLPFPARSLIITQKLSAGLAPALAMREITSDAQGEAFFGAGSIGAQQVKAYRAANKTGALFAMAMDDVAGGTAATGTITFTGAGNGTVAHYINGKRVPVTATSLLTVSQLATATAAAINADTSLPVTAASALGVVTLTARHKGVCGNDIDIRVNRFLDDVVPTGLTVAIAAMGGGATNPTLQTALDALVGQWFTDIVIPWSDGANLSALSAWAADRYKAMGKLDCHGYAGARGTYGQLGTAGALTNSPFITMIGANKPGSSPWELAASLAGVAAFQLTNDPARQLRSLALPGVWIDAKDQFTDQEQDLLLRQGISTWTALNDGTIVLDRVVTMYKVSNLNVPDRAWLDIMVPKTMTRVRYDWASHVTLLYPRHKLADDYSPAADASDAVVTPRRMAGTWASRCKLYERAGWIEDVRRTVDESLFYRSPNDRNRLEASQQVQIIGNLMVLAGALEFQV